MEEIREAVQNGGAMAKKQKKGIDYFVLEGDWGGQIYLTVPVSQVKVSEGRVLELLKLIDKVSWDCNEGDGASLQIITTRPNMPVSGGMGGGMHTSDLWMHPMTPKSLRDLAGKFLKGELDKLPSENEIAEMQSDRRMWKNLIGSPGSF